MKAHYDFSKGKRGQFHDPDAVFMLPVYLDPDVQTYLSATAQAKGVELAELVNSLLKKDIELIEAAK